MSRIQLEAKSVRSMRPTSRRATASPFWRGYTADLSPDQRSAKQLATCQAVRRRLGKPVQIVGNIRIDGDPFPPHKFEACRDRAPGARVANQALQIRQLVFGQQLALAGRGIDAEQGAAVPPD